MKTIKSPPEYYIPLFFWLLFATAGLFSIDILWGINFIGFWPLPVKIILLLLTFIFILPPVTDRILKADFRSGKIKKILPLITAVILLVPLFYLLSSSTTLLGDGNLRINQVIKGESFFLPTEILDFYLHSQIYDLIFKPNDWYAVTSYQIFSIVCGFFFLIGLYRLVSYLSQNQTVLLYILLISSGMTALFFGYIESYSLIAALLPFIILSGLKTADSSSSVGTIILWYLIAGLIHSSALILLVGLPVAAILNKRQKSEELNTRPDIILICLALLLLVMLYIGRFFDLYNIGYYLLPLFGTADYKIGLLSWHHLSNLLNWTLLAGLPLLLMVPAIYKIITKPGFHPGGRDRLSIWMILPSLFFILFFIPRLGGPRDWDLFSLPFFLILTAAAIFLSSGEKRKLPKALLAVAIIALANTVTFAVINSSVEKSAERYISILEASRFKNLSKEYLTLVTHSESYPQLTKNQLDYAERAWREPPYTKDDSVFVLQKLSAQYTQRGDRQKAWNYLTTALQTDTLNFFSHLLLINYLNAFASMNEILATAELIEKRFPDEAAAQSMCALIFIQSGDSVRGEASFEKAVNLEGADFTSLVNYGTYMLGKQNWAKAAELLEKAVAVDKKNFLSHYYLSAAYLKLGQLDKAMQVFRKTRDMRKNAEQEIMFQELQTELIRLSRLGSTSDKPREP